MDSSTTRGTALGLSLIALLALSVTLLAECSWAQQLRLSPMVLGVVLGMLLADTLRPQLPEGWDGAFRIAGKQLLRAGIVFYGCRLTLEALTELGPEAILIDTIIVLGTLLLGELLGRALRLERSERLLIASGSAICGAAAVLATEPVVRARSHSTVVAVGTVVLFGTLSMFVYPLLYRWGALEALGLRGVGIYTGATVHEVAHVVGAGAAMSPEIAALATLTKMIRVLLLAPVLLGLSFLMRERHAGGSASGKGRVQIPWFACYFILVVLANSLLAHLSSTGSWTESYRTVTGWIQTADTFVLTMAMTAIGMEARLAKFRQSGAKPFLLALGLYLWLVGGGYLLVRLLA
nr:putative sulfate exporter family transporter [uncultured Porphyromonas sp.]